MSVAENSTVAARTVGRPFARGKSGNPGGRSQTARDVQTLAQQHGPAAIGALAQALKSKNERVRVAAAAILLDRGFGRPAQRIETDGQSHLHLHLLAAQLIEPLTLEAQLEQHPNDGYAEAGNGKALLDISAPPLE